jgi:cell division protein ZapA
LETNALGQVNVQINGRKYQIACDDGQEAHLSRLGNYVDSRVNELVAAVGQIEDARLLVMVSLLIADELSDSYAELEVARKADDGASAVLSAEETLSSKIDNITNRIESIAVSFE